MADFLTLKEQCDALKIGMTFEEVRRISPKLETFWSSSGPRFSNPVLGGLLIQSWPYDILPRYGAFLVFRDNKLQGKEWYGFTLGRVLKHWAGKAHIRLPSEVTGRALSLRPR